MSPRSKFDHQHPRIVTFGHPHHYVTDTTVTSFNDHVLLSLNSAMAGEQYMLYLENKRFANKHDMERRASHPKSYLLSSDETFSNKYQY